MQAAPTCIAIRCCTNVCILYTHIYTVHPKLHKAQWFQSCICCTGVNQSTIFTLLFVGTLNYFKRIWVATNRTEFWKRLKLVFFLWCLWDRGGPISQKVWWRTGTLWFSQEHVEVVQASNLDASQTPPSGGIPGISTLRKPQSKPRIS